MTKFPYHETQVFLHQTSSIIYICTVLSLLTFFSVLRIMLIYNKIINCFSVFSIAFLTIQTVCNRYAMYRYWIVSLLDSNVVNLLIIQCTYHIIRNSPGCSLIYSCRNRVFCFVLVNYERISTYISIHAHPHNR